MNMADVTIFRSDRHDATAAQAPHPIVLPIAAAFPFLTRYYMKKVIVSIGMAYTE
jgi:hypothetical protein